MSKSVSVIMSTYNETEYELSQAIESILNQSMSDFEFIIINDNPGNEVLSSILNYYKQSDSRIVIIENESNLGLVASLNKGINVSQGKYIARMDADDISDIKRFEKEIEFLEHNNLDVVSSLKRDIDSQGNVIAEYYRPKLLTEDMKVILPLATIIVHSSVLIKAEVIKKCGCYRDIKAIEDYDLWLRCLSNNAKFGLLNEYLLYYRVRNNSITSFNLYRSIVSTIIIQSAFRKGILSSHDFDPYFIKKSHKFHIDNVSVAEKYKVKHYLLLDFKKHPSLFSLVKILIFAMYSQVYRSYIINCIKLNMIMRKK